jgi:hypothetical protein
MRKEIYPYFKEGYNQLQTRKVQRGDQEYEMDISKMGGKKIT